MKNCLLILLIIFCAISGITQNIINNPSFEDTLHDNFGLLKARYWNVPTISSPDLLHLNNIHPWKIPQNFSGYQSARDGVSYYGFFSFVKNGDNGREYIQNQLKRALLRDSIYCFQAFVSLADSSNYALKNEIGAYFSRNPINSSVRFQRLDLDPQIEFSDTMFFTEKINWIKVFASFKAEGGEKFMTLGVFKPDSLLDVVRVFGGLDTVFHKTYYYIDDLYLGHCDSVPTDDTVPPIGIAEQHLVEEGFSLYPNPVKEQFYLELEKEQSNIQFKLLNILGQEQDFSVQKQANRYTFNVGHLPKGLYLLQFSGNLQHTIKILKD